jgi:hypothetical protein
MAGTFLDGLLDGDLATEYNAAGPIGSVPSDLKRIGVLLAQQLRSSHKAAGTVTPATRPAVPAPDPAAPANSLPVTVAPIPPAAPAAS